MSDANRNEKRQISGNRDNKRGSKQNAGGGGKKPSKSPTEVGRALRSVYDATLGERVPSDFLDLLGKLS